MTGVHPWPVTLHDRWPYMTAVHPWPVTLHGRCPYMTGDLTWPVSLHDRWPYMTGVHPWPVTLHDRCPSMTGDLTWQVSLHGRCPYMTGVLLPQVPLHSEYGTPFWENSPPIGLFLEEGHISLYIFYPDGDCFNVLFFSEIFPYLVVIIGLENVLVVTKSVVSTPHHLDVKYRVAQGKPHKKITNYYSKKSISRLMNK